MSRSAFSFLRYYPTGNPWSSIFHRTTCIDRGQRRCQQSSKFLAGWRRWCALLYQGMIVKVAEEHLLSIEITLIKIGLMEWFAAVFGYNFSQEWKETVTFVFSHKLPNNIPCKIVCHDASVILPILIFHVNINRWCCWIVFFTVLMHYIFRYWKWWQRQWFRTAHKPLC